jgi:hypothetical protein
MSDRRPTAPIALTDAELTAIMVAAQPIPVDRRDAFLQKVASTLRESAEVGPGTVHRGDRPGAVGILRPAAARVGLVVEIRVGRRSPNLCTVQRFSKTAVRCGGFPKPVHGAWVSRNRSTVGRFFRAATSAQT